jgi:integrase
MKKPCSCFPNESLPRGLRCNKGYLELYIARNGQLVVEAFGKDNKDHRKFAKIRLAELTVQLQRGTYKAPSSEVELTTAEALDIFYRLHGPNLTSEKARIECQYALFQLKAAVGHILWHELNYQHCQESIYQAAIDKGLKNSTIRKRFMWLSLAWTKFNFWNETVPTKLKQRVKMQTKNPVTLAKESIGRRGLSVAHLARTRVPSREEVKAAKAWCMANDPELWQAIKQAVILALRKQDLIKAQTLNGPVHLTQSKTGKPINIPFVIQRPVSFVNFRNRWDRLREAMNWHVVGSPTHTTWHDMRHMAATILAELGYSMDIISEALGDTVEQARRYVNRKVSLEQVEKELDAL